MSGRRVFIRFCFLSERWLFTRLYLLRVYSNWGSGKKKKEKNICFMQWRIHICAYVNTHAHQCLSHKNLQKDQIIVCQVSTTFLSTPPTSIHNFLSWVSLGCLSSAPWQDFNCESWGRQQSPQSHFSSAGDTRWDLTGPEQAEVESSESTSTLERLGLLF